MRDLLFYEIAILVFCGFQILRNLIKVLKKSKNWREFLISTIFWIMLASLGIFQSISDNIARITGFTLGINALLVSSITILFYFVLIFHLRNEKQDQIMTKLVREIALRDLDK